MAKKNIPVLTLILFLCLSNLFLSAQHTLFFASEDKDFIQGKELYFQQKYAASYRSFEQFLEKKTFPSDGQFQEAEYFLSANAYELRKENALSLLQTFLTKHPYTPFSEKIYFMIGVLNCEQKNYTVARENFSQVNEQELSENKIPEFLFYKGYTAIQTQHYEEAGKIFSRLKLQNSPFRVDATYYYAYSEYMMGNYQKALPDFLAIENHPDYQISVPYFLVQIYYVEKQYAKLKEKADFLLQKYPNNKNNAEIFRILGELAYGEQNYAQAISYFKKYENLSPKVLRNDVYLLGLSYFQLKDYSNAIQYLSKVTTEPDEISENAYLHLGTSYVFLNDKTNARLSFEAALQTHFNPTVREEALFNYALTCYETTSAFGESVAAFTRFLSEFPNSKYADEAYQYLTSVYLTTKNYELAYQSILKIRKLNTSLTETKQYLLYQMGVNAFAQKDYGKAIEYFSLAHTSAPKGKYSAECLFWRAECYYRTNNPDQAIVDLETFIKNPLSRNSENLIYAYYSLGYGYFDQKNYIKALEWFSKYLENENSEKSMLYADALTRAGDCHFYARNFKNALSFYEKAAFTSPNTADYSIFQSAYVEGLQKNYLNKIYRLEQLLLKYPDSEYGDDALYEIGRSYLMLKNEKMALSTYERLMNQYPSSVLSRKAALESGMIYFNRQDFENAIVIFKYVAEKYPDTEESYIALKSMESAYIELNDVNGFLQYTKNSGRIVRPLSVMQEDSISYIAAEKQYINGRYTVAISGFENYLNNFCPGGRYCTIAQFYLADSYYRTQQRDKALKAYEVVLKTNAAEYVEQAALHCAEITYDRKDYASAFNYFKQLKQVAQNSANKQAAHLGMLRCSYFTNDYQSLIDIANVILQDPYSEAIVKTEARFYRAKAYLLHQQLNAAIEDLKIISADTKTAFGAESKYLLASVYFQQEKLTEAENEILDFAKKNTPHQFWLARSFVLLADIYIKKGNDFQAKQYLLSLKRNYTVQDEIQGLIDERLSAISQREKKNIIH